MKLDVLNLDGQAQGSVDVSFPIIENGSGTQAVHDAVVAFRAAGRSGTACTKTMGEVAGTGKKPWRQKGTGRARAGSFQSPLWRGGGVVFGPKPRDYSKKLSKGTKRLALRKALSERLKDQEVTLVDQLSLSEPKTKLLDGILLNLGVAGTALLVVQNIDRNLLLASRNLTGVEVVTADTLNTYQTLKYDRIIATREAFEILEGRVSPGPCS